MATLTVWKYPTPDGAEKIRDRLVQFQKQELIELHDAVVVTWPEGKRHPKTKQALSTTGAGAAGGAFWGLLFGIIFFVPFFGMAIGAAAGALSGSLQDFGIDDEFIDRVRQHVTPGTSALFLMSSNAVVDRIEKELDGEHSELIATNLSVDDEEALRALFEG